MREPNPNVQPEQAQAIWDAARPSAGSGPSERVVTAHCTLITPMFGGGVTAGEVDPEMPIRASALRGQLRFWWRLLHGAGKKPADLFADESDLWARPEPAEAVVCHRNLAAPPSGQRPCCTPAPAPQSEAGDRHDQARPLRRGV